MRYIFYAPASLKDGPTISECSTPIMSERQFQVSLEGSPEEIVLTPYTSTNVTAITLIEAAVFTQPVHVQVGLSAGS